MTRNIRLGCYDPSNVCIHLLSSTPSICLHITYNALLPARLMSGKLSPRHTSTLGQPLNGDDPEPLISSDGTSEIAFCLSINDMRYAHFHAWENSKGVSAYMGAREIP